MKNILRFLTLCGLLIPTAVVLAPGRAEAQASYSTAYACQTSAAGGVTYTFNLADCRLQPPVIFVSHQCDSTGTSACMMTLVAKYNQLVSPTPTSAVNPAGRVVECTGAGGIKVRTVNPKQDCIDGSWSYPLDQSLTMPTTAPPTLPRTVPPTTAAPIQVIIVQAPVTTVPKTVPSSQDGWVSYNTRTSYRVDSVTIGLVRYTVRSNGKTTKKVLKCAVKAAPGTLSAILRKTYC